MAQVIWTAEARRWLQEIYDYIAEDNEDAAYRTVRAIHEHDNHELKPLEDALAGVERPGDFYVDGLVPPSVCRHAAAGGCGFRNALLEPAGGCLRGGSGERRDETRHGGPGQTNAACMAGDTRNVRMGAPRRANAEPQPSGHARPAGALGRRRVDRPVSREHRGDNRRRSAGGRRAGCGTIVMGRQRRIRTRCGDGLAG